MSGCLQVAAALGTLFVWLCAVILLGARQHLGRLFSRDTVVVRLTAQTVPAMALSLLGKRHLGGRGAGSWAWLQTASTRVCGALVQLAEEMSSVHKHVPPTAALVVDPRGCTEVLL